MVLSVLSEIDVHALPYYDMLKDIRAFFRSIKPQRGQKVFPTGYCHVASKVASKVTGLDLVAGDYDRGRGLLVDHGLNFDSQRGLYIDITRDQFDPCAPEVLVEEVDNSRFFRLPSIKDWSRRWSADQISAIRVASARHLGQYLSWRRNRDLFLSRQLSR